MHCTKLQHFHAYTLYFQEMSSVFFKLSFNKNWFINTIKKICNSCIGKQQCVISLHFHLYHYTFIFSHLCKTYHGSSQTQVLYRTGDTAGRLGGTNCGPQLHHSLIKISRVVWVYNLIGQTPKFQKKQLQLYTFLSHEN